MAREADQWVETFVRNAETKAVVLIVVAMIFNLKRDPKDEPYLNLALAAGARYLVTRDHDLLDLMNDEDFRRRYPDLIILDPAAFLRDLTQEGQLKQATEPELPANPQSTPGQEPAAMPETRKTGDEV